MSNHSPIPPRRRLAGAARNVGAILACLAAAAVPAQPAASPPVLAAAADVPVPQVVVTGARFAAPVTAAASIGAQVITAEEIRRSGATSVFDALRRLGGVFTRSSLFGTSDDSVDLRGFGVTADQNTLVLIDGVRVSENEQQPARLSALPLNSIEKIEILRGGGAVMYGGGATGGVINVITREPAAGRHRFDLFLGGGSFGTTDRRLGAAIAGGGIAVDFHANRYASSGYRRNNGVEQENAVASVRLSGERASIGLKLASERARAQLPGALTEGQYTADPRQATAGLSATDTDANHYALNARYQWDQAEAIVDISRRDKVNRYFFDTMPFGSNFSRNGAAVDAASPRLRLTAPWFGRPNALVVGFDAARWSYKSQVAGSPVGAVGEADLGGAALVTDETGRQTNRAWYFRNDTELRPDLRVSVGARRETVHQRLTNPLVPMAAEQSLELHAEEAALAWDPLPGWTASVRAGNSYRIGNIDDNRCRFANFICPGPAPGTLLAPQSARDTDVQLSYRSRPVDAELRLYRSRLDNEIFFASVPGPGPFFFPTQQQINLPPTLREGIELRGRWRARPDLAVHGFAARTTARFRSGTVLGRDYAGKDIPVVPAHRVNLGVDWQVTPVDAVNLAWQHVGSQVYDNDQTNECGRRIPAYQLFDAKITRRIGAWSVSLVGTNLANRNYYGYALCNSTAGRLSVYPERPRALFLTVEGRF